MENMDEDDLEMIRRKRIEDMKKAQVWNLNMTTFIEKGVTQSHSNCNVWFVICTCPK